jgi:geranylgeranyl diphosphate synthase, type II
MIARSEVDAALRRLSESRLEPVHPRVRDAIAYALEGGGKRLRARLFLAAYHACGGAGAPYLLAATIEVVHAYSLVHDDLPCMDDDDVRRGRPTVHRAFTVPVATVAGVAMVPLAVRGALEGAQELGLPDATAAEIVRVLMQASGAGGMIGGQLLDLEGERQSLTLAELERVHRGKTGALIAASARLGGLAAGAPRERLEALDRFGASIGLAFQIADDILDVTATSDQLGKTAGKDQASGKSTYVALLGVDGARDRAAALVEEGCDALRRTGLLDAELEGLARFSVHRPS